MLPRLKKFLATTHWTEYAGFTVLLVTSCIAGFLYCKQLTLNPDALISVYTFTDGGLGLSDLFIADWHTNLLKMPILLLQAQFPFNELSFAIGSAILLFAAFFGWAFAVGLTLGRKYFAPTAVVLSMLVGGSLLFSFEAGFTTIRNIEYPIFFLLIILFWKIFSLDLKKREKRLWLYVAGYITGMTILLASDPFFAYASIPALLVVLGARYLTGKVDRRGATIGLLLVFLPAVFSKVVIWALIHIGVFQYFGAHLSPMVYQFQAIPTAFWGAVLDLVAIYGAFDMFGSKLKLGHVDQYALFLLLGVSIASMIWVMKNIKQWIARSPILATLCISAVFLFAMYMMSPSFEHQHRFLIIIALTMSTTLVAWIYSYRSFIAKYGRTVIVLGIIGIVFLTGFACRQYYNSEMSEFVQEKNGMLAITKVLQEEDVETVIAGHTYVSLAKFWGENDLRMAPVLYCNQNLPFLTRESWYTPIENGLTAIIVDRKGRDAHSWACSEERFIEYYGEPLKMITVNGLNNKPVDVYIYPNDVVNKIQIIKERGEPKPLLN